MRLLILDQPDNVSSLARYVWSMLDRAALLRTRHDELDTLLRGDDGLFVPMWRNRNLVVSSKLARLDRDAALVSAADEIVFLGKLEDRPYFALALPASDDAAALCAAHGDFDDLRMAGPFMDRSDAELAAYARGMIYWHRNHRYCGKCGSTTTSTDFGHVRVCGSCEKRHFPRTDPAVMALIMDGDRCVLARQPRFPPNMFSILAGFVEPGETLEVSVAREVREEVGLEVTDLRYVSSQPWPFPASLMLGWVMRATTTDIHLDDDELEEARWFSRDEVRSGAGILVPPSFSLAGQLIELWLADEL